MQINNKASKKRLRREDRKDARELLERENAPFTFPKGEEERDFPQESFGTFWRTCFIVPDTSGVESATSVVASPLSYISQRR